MNRKIGALVLALVVVGCGGSGTLSRAELVKQANAICRRRTAQIESIRGHYARDFRGFLVAAFPAARKSLDELQALKPPSSLKHSYEEFLSGERAQIEHVRAIVAAQKAGRRPGPGEGVTQIHRQGRIVHSLGLEACS